MSKDEARQKTAEFFRNNSLAIRKKDSYADHITEEQKENYLKEDLEWADAIERGDQDHNLTVAQRMHYYMTGKTVAILP